MDQYISSNAGGMAHNAPMLLVFQWASEIISVLKYAESSISV
jgi:hypothetical protein